MCVCVFVLYIVAISNLVYVQIHWNASTHLKLVKKMRYETMPQKIPSILQQHGHWFAGRELDRSREILASQTQGFVVSIQITFSQEMIG